MNWQGISEFVAVAEKSSFTQGAKKLGLSTAQVSRQINALEQRLNSKLLYRTTRKVSLTHEGNLFYHRCRPLIEGLDEAQRAINDLQSQPKGHIKMTAPVTYGEQVILPLVNDFLSEHPDITLEAYLTNKRIDLLEDGYDLAIRLGELADSTLIARKISQRQHHICASPDYLANHGEPLSLEDLTGHNCLQGSVSRWRLMDAGKAIQYKVNGSLKYNSGTALLDAALKGHGIIQLPEFYVAPYLANQQLTELLPQMRTQAETIWVTYPHNRQLSPKIKHLISYLQAHL